MNKFLMIFVDGVGIGKKDYEFNPFFKYGFKTFQNIFGDIPHLGAQELVKDGLFLFPSDANLGVEGLPQSGTGQNVNFLRSKCAKIYRQTFWPLSIFFINPGCGN